MVELTPAVQDAAYRLGWAMKRARLGWNESEQLVYGAIATGAEAFTPEGEAERVEGAKAAHWAMAGTVERRSIIAGAARMEMEALNFSDTQGQVPDAFDEWARGLGMISP